MAYVTGYNGTNFFSLENIPQIASASNSIAGLLQEDLDLVADLMHLATVGYRSQSYTTAEYPVMFTMNLPDYQIWAFGGVGTAGSVINQITFEDNVTGSSVIVSGAFNYAGLPFLSSITSGQIQNITQSTYVGVVENTTGIGGALVLAADGSYAGTLASYYEMTYNNATSGRVDHTFLLDVEALMDAANLSSTVLTDGVVSYFASQYITLGDTTTIHDYVLGNGLNVDIETTINEWQVNSGDDTYFLSGLLGNIVQTGGGKDIIYVASTVNNFVDGGDGIDSASYYGSSYEYEILAATGADPDTVSNADGSNSYENVERLVFWNGNVALDVGHGENAGMAYRIYQAAFDRTPDESGLGFWIDALDQGYTLEQVATAVMTSPEFEQVYGVNSSNRTFVDLLYQHVLHRTADDEGFNFWNDALNAGYSRGAVLAVYTECPETIALTAEVVANGIFYQPWVA